MTATDKKYTRKKDVLDFLNEFEGAYIAHVPGIVVGNLSYSLHFAAGPTEDGTVEAKLSRSLMERLKKDVRAVRMHQTNQWRYFHVDAAQGKEYAEQAKRHADERMAAIQKKKDAEEAAYAKLKDTTAAKVLAFIEENEWDWQEARIPKSERVLQIQEFIDSL